MNTKKTYTYSNNKRYSGQLIRAASPSGVAYQQKQAMQFQDDMVAGY